MKHRVLALALALGVGTSGCMTWGQHRTPLPAIMLTAVVVGGIIVAVTYRPEKCTDPACGASDFRGGAAPGTGARLGP